VPPTVPRPTVPTAGSSWIPAIEIGERPSGLAAPTMDLISLAWTVWDCLLMRRGATVARTVGAWGPDRTGAAAGRVGVVAAAFAAGGRRGSILSLWPRPPVQQTGRDTR
jgi:hypothetical protein